MLFEACGALGRFDAREAGYDRVELRADQLEVLGGETQTLTLTLTLTL